MNTCLTLSTQDDIHLYGFSNGSCVDGHRWTELDIALITRKFGHFLDNIQDMVKLELDGSPVDLPVPGSRLILPGQFYDEDRGGFEPLYLNFYGDQESWSHVVDHTQNELGDRVIKPSSHQVTKSPSHTVTQTLSPGN